MIHPADQGTTFLFEESVRTGETGRSSSIGLPPVLLDQARGRVGLIALLICVVSLFVLFSDVPVEGFRPVFDGWGAGFSWFVILTSAALFAATKSTRIGPERILALGLSYEILLCFLISLLEPVGAVEIAESLGGEAHIADLLPSVTWVTPFIIMFPLIIPTPPRKMLLVAIISALTVPVGIGIHVAFGTFEVHPRAYPHTFLSPAIAAAVAYFGSRIIYNIGLDVSRARQMGSYRLESLLGTGGMGEVWRARHRLLARPAAVKLVKRESLGVAEPGQSGVILQRFEREAQTTALLRSPHTIELYDFGVSDEGVFYYVMELLEGFDLHTMVSKFGPISAERTVHLLEQACSSLAEAHESGLIHRDVKPANIYVCRYGRDLDFVKVLDFGLVKTDIESGESDVELTARGEVSGTPAFMSPEQILGTTPVDARSDIYALACVAYWMVTGCLVFEGENRMQVLMQHANSEPLPPSTRSEVGIPAAFDALILRCLSKDPDERPASMDEFSLRLREVQGSSEWTPVLARSWWTRYAPESSFQSPKGFAQA